jgi:RNA polymerase sigma-70 factor (ECF subfamily)
MSKAGHSNLISAAKRGDPGAFEDLIRPEYRSAFRLAYGMLHSISEAEDVVQEAVFKAWRRLGNLRDGAPLGPWLLGIVANECRAARRRKWWSVLVNSELAVEESRDDPDLTAHADLKSALRALSHDQRLVLVLRYYLDLPYDQVGQVLGVSEKAARLRAQRALAKMRPLMRVEEVMA